MAERKSRSRSRSRQTKDRVLQARIPRHLDEELRDHAEQLGLSVSTVVRNVLLNTFELVEGVVADSTESGAGDPGAKAQEPARATGSAPGTMPVKAVLSGGRKRC